MTSKKDNKSKIKLGIIMPCYNEGMHLEKDVLRVHKYMKDNFDNFDINFSIIISDSNSTDNTKEISKRLTKKFNNIKYNTLSKKGKGLAVKNSVMKFDFDWYLMYDSDIPVEPKFLKPMINLIMSNKYDLICANRHGKNAKLITSLKRKIISHGTTFMVNIVLQNFKIKDSQAGFKAWNKKIKKSVWPLVKDEKFFFDIELIYFTYKKGLKIKYFPVIYKIDEDKSGGSKVKLFKDIYESLMQLFKLRFRKF
jgi:glycosyltransferase involved in cell wall biosynthesis